MATGAHSILAVSGPDWSNTRLIPISGATVSWVVSEPGTFSCFIPAHTAYLHGISEWKGKWASWDHATLGNWSGVILDDPVTLDDGTMELAGQDVSRHFHGRTIPYLVALQQAPAGALVRRAISLAAYEIPLWITDVSCSEDGGWFEPEGRSDDLLEFIRQMQSDSGYEWIAGKNDDGSLYFRFGETVGEDKCGSILLADGYQIAGGSLTRSIEPIVNDLTVIADDRDFHHSAAANAQNAASIERFGRVRASIRQSGAVNLSTIEPQARAMVRRSSLPVNAATIRLPDTHPILTEIRRGDTIRLWLGTANAELAFRCLSLTADTSTGTVEIAGDAVAMGDLAA